MDGGSVHYGFHEFRGDPMVESVWSSGNTTQCSILGHCYLPCARNVQQKCYERKRMLQLQQRNFRFGCRQKEYSALVARRSNTNNKRTWIVSGGGRQLGGTRGDSREAATLDEPGGGAVRWTVRWNDGREANPQHGRGDNEHRVGRRRALAPVATDGAWAGQLFRPTCEEVCVVDGAGRRAACGNRRAPGR